MSFQVQIGKNIFSKNKNMHFFFCNLKGRRLTTELPSGEANFDAIHPHLSEMLKFLGK